MRLLLTACFCLLSVPTNADTVTIDFEEQISLMQSGGPYDPDYSIYADTKGFRLETNDFNAVFGILPGDGEDDSTGLTWCPTCTITMEAINGSLFDLSYAHFTMQWVGNQIGTDAPFTVTGYLAGGGQVQVASSVVRGMPGETLSFDSSWSNLSAVSFNAGNSGMTIDNIVVSVVPIPAAVWLFGSALAGLGWMRRRQAV